MPRPARGPRPPALRSKVTNGTRLFLDGDENGVVARRFRDLEAAHVASLEQAEPLSETQKTLCRMCAGLRLSMEQMEAMLSRGEIIDHEAYQRTANTLVRQIAKLDKTRKEEKPLGWRDRAKVTGA